MMTNECVSRPSAGPIRRLHRVGRLLGAVAAVFASPIPLRAAEPASRPASAPSSQPIRPIDVVRGATLAPWKPAFVGVEVCEASAVAPRRVEVRAARIDLREPTIDFLVTPSNGERPLDCDARTTSQFLAEFRCQLAVNGSFFDPLAKADRDPQDVIGVSLSRGDLYSPPQDRWDALLISRDRRAWIALSPVEPGDAYNGLAGHVALVLSGRICVDPSDTSGITRLNPRTAAGVTKDGRYLVLLVIDGRQPGWSDGATLAETAEWARALGCHNAINLDGGGSSALVIEGPDGKPQVLNRPSGGVERRVANHLGVFARRRNAAGAAPGN